MSDAAPNPTTDSRTDLQLIDAVNRGDADAFAALYHRHHPYATRIAMRYTSDRNLALDAVQDSFVYFYKKFPGFALTAKLTTFLYPVVKHNALSLKQKAKRAQGDTSEKALESQPAATPATGSSTEPDADDLHALLRNLPGAQREVLVLRFVDGLSVQEIAEALDIPPGTVKTRTHHAIKKLRDSPAAKKYFNR